MDKISLLLVVTLATSFNALADQETELLPAFSPAKVKKRFMPVYPGAELRSGAEGIVTLSYVIDEKGRVVDPLVEISSGRDSFDWSALSAIKKWRFNPAKRDGESIQQCRSNQDIFFVLAKREGVSKKFQRRFTKIIGLIERKQLGLAAENLATLRKKSRWDLTEGANIHLLDAEYYAAKGQTSKQLAALKTASRYKKVISAEIYLTTLTKIFALDLDSNNLAHALNTFERIEAADKTGEHAAKLGPYAQQARAAIAGKQAIVVAANLEGKTVWSHQLARQQFTLMDLRGTLDLIEFRCDYKRSSYPAETDKTFRVPASWGGCRVFVSGETGASFDLVELPKGA